MRVRTAVAATLGGLLLAGLPSPADAGKDDEGDKPRVVVIGDSLTHWSKRFLVKRAPDWTIDSRRGRPVKELPELVEQHLAEGDPPQAMVLALGTNSSPEWTAQDYVDVLALVPAETAVLFVSTYRDPAVFGEEKAERLREYSQWMREAAAARTLTRVVPWRSRVLKGVVTLRDGVHASRPVGERYWARLVLQRVRAAVDAAEDAEDS